LTITSVERHDTWGVTATLVLRRLSAVTWAGALLGLAVGGIGSRLAMMLLARLNPDFTGTTSDDGFTMGHLTPDTLDLMVVTTLIGVFGGGIYFAVRGLMVGPRWFQILSISVGPAVVVGSQLVHPDGVDFLLDPAWLAIALFVAIPGVYSALLTVLAERWVAPERTFMTAPLWLAAAPLLLWLPIAPFLAVLLLGLAALEWARRTRRGAAVLGHPTAAWAARGALGLVFAAALVELVRDAGALV
jgi:hypothetical protein